MRRLVLILIALLVAFSANAQMYVYGVNGEASVCRDGKWFTAYSSLSLQPTDLLKTGDGSYVVVLDRGERKMYSFQSAFPRTLSELVRVQKPKIRSLLGEVCQGIYNSIFAKKGSEDFAYNNVSGVTYRSEDDDRMIAAAIASGQPSSSKVSFRFVDMNGNALNRIQSGQVAYVEVVSRLDYPVFVNLIDVDSRGSVAPVFSLAQMQAQIRLFVPPHSVVRFEGMPVEFYEPLGMDQIILIASRQPFDVKNVLKLLPTVDPGISKSVALSRQTITIYR